MNLKLNEYNQKRNFEKTFEPEGKVDNSKENLKFVVQHHIARREHYDLRFEWKGVLLSWAVPKGLSYDTHDKRLAVKVEDHPLEYRNFEGTIPKGEYGGGTVMIWDEGWWEPYSDVETGLQEGILKFLLKGRRLKGKWTLVKLKEKAGDSKDNWLLLKEKDEYTKEDNGVSSFTTSIRTGRTMKEIEYGESEVFKKNPFDRIDVQLAKLVNKVPENEDWLYEMKYDGYRIIAFTEGNKTRLLTRNGNDYTNRFKNIANLLTDLAGGRAMVLDGEMTVTDTTGKTDFQALQSFMKKPGSQDLIYIVFDLLALDGLDLRSYRLIERKEKLEALMKNSPRGLYYSQHVKENGKECYAAACESGMEGIVGKRADSFYTGTRNGDWIKLKCDKRQEFIVGGYTLSNKKSSGISSLLLAVYKSGELIYIGRAGTGMDDSTKKVLTKKFEELKSNKSFFKIPPKPKLGEAITWLEPELVAEIKFAEWTEDELLRQASFKGLRTDKDPRDIIMETAEDEHESHNKEMIMERNTDSIIIQGITITNPHKVIFEETEITKEDVIRYYDKVSKRMLPYLSHRILSIVRCPKGISQTCFYKKHPGPESKGVVTIPILTSNGESEVFFYIENSSGLITEAQMGTLEFHTWGSQVNELEKPDIMVFDLDPDEEMDPDRIRKGVEDIKSILSELSLNTYLKTSGGKGYHVVVPLNPSVSWDVFYDFARRIAELMEKKWPDRYTSNVRKAKRTDKIFIDWMRNGRGATSIAPYSIRARKGAKVSMPISWDELYSVTPDGINMADALIRISGADPWEGFFKNNQKLK